MPPSRYKVVEEGRRLIVRDTWNGNVPVTGHMARPKRPGDSGRLATVEQASAALHKDRPRQAPRPGASTPDPTAFTLTTRSWFDNKAPRQLRVEGQGQGALLVAAVVFVIVAAIAFTTIGWPAPFVAGFVLLQPKIRNAMRAGTTSFLDGLDKPAGE